MSSSFFIVVITLFILGCQGQNPKRGLPPPQGQYPTRPPPPPRLPPRPRFPSLGGPLLPRQPANRPGPLSNRNLVLFITQELKRNITSDPQNYTGSWVGRNYCLFKGFYCDTVPDKNITGLAGIDFNGARFRGNLNFYRFIRFLPDIAIFHANSNNFSGVIRPNINKLRYFYEIDLSNNGFQGGFPVSVIGALQLTFVDVRFNTYNGPVPPRVFSIQTDVLFINNNNFAQRIPSAFGNTTARYITLANNGFIGSIPQSIGRTWQTLTEVLFLKNRLSGCLPYEIGFLQMATVFDAGFNTLTGPIPQSFACLKKLQLLSLAHNQFYGRIPDSLCRLPNAYNFTLSYNYFNSIGPYCKRLVNIGRLDVRRNCITGLPNQRSAAECTAFYSVSRTCPRPGSFNVITCSNPAASLSSAQVASLQAMAPAPSPVTYKALEPPR